MSTTIIVKFSKELNFKERQQAMSKIGQSLQTSQGDLILGGFGVKIFEEKMWIDCSDQTGVISDSSINKLQIEMEKLHKRDEVWELRYKRALEFLNRMV